MPDITTPTNAEVVKAVISAVGAVQDAHGTMVTGDRDLSALRAKFPLLQSALNGKLNTLSMDTTKIGGMWATTSYELASKGSLPAGGTWIILYCTSFKYGSDRAASTAVSIYPGGTKITTVSYDWWCLCIRIS